MSSRVVGLGDVLRLSSTSGGVAGALRSSWQLEVDVTQPIGRRYRRQDEIGTPFCVTVDFDTLDDKAVLFATGTQ